MSYDYNKAPEFHILVCQVFIWDMADKTKIFDPPTSPIVITEVESIEIVESYKKFIGTATVNLPRGTIIRKVLTPENLDDELGKVSLYEDSVDYGITEGSVAYKASTADFKVGKRIKINFGYATSQDNVGNALKGEAAPWFKDLFVVFITQCSMKEPIPLNCEHIDFHLKKITRPNIR